MVFIETELPGVFIMEVEPKEDKRGFFARSFCRREFESHGLKASLAQCNISFNHFKGTLRGLHLQRFPCQEAKVVRCTAGAIFDVVVDLRPTSPACLRHIGVELTAVNRRMLYVPEGCAHGFQTLTDNTELEYLMSEFHSPEHATGVRYDDPALGIRWPLPLECISEADRTWPDYVRTPE